MLYSLLGHTDCQQQRHATLLDAMSNLYGYNDYNGPRIMEEKEDDEEKNGSVFPAREGKNEAVEDDKEDYDDDDPLRCGFWMEGDSLAPPCGTSLALIRPILSFAKVTADDVVYDLGCGDGRICIEALVEYDCRHCVGIEIESDLVERANEIVSSTTTKLPEKFKKKHGPASQVPRIQVLAGDLEDCLSDLLVVGRGGGENKQSTGPFSDLPIPTIIVVYLLPESIRKIEDKLIALMHTARIVCISWGLTRIVESDSIEIEGEGGTSTSIFLYHDKNTEVAATRSERIL